MLLVTLTQLHLHLHAWQAGLVFGAAGVGGLLSSAMASHIYDWGWQRGLASALGVAAVGSVGLAWASVLDPGRGFAVALASSLVLDEAIALGFVLSSTASTLVTPRDLRERVGAVGAVYEALVCGGAAIGLGALAATGAPLSAFVVLACCCAGAALVTVRVRASAGVVRE